MDVSAIDRAAKIRALLQGHEGLSILAGVEEVWLGRSDDDDADDDTLFGAIIAYLSGRYAAAVRRFDAALKRSEAMSDHELGEAYYVLSRCLAALGEQVAATALAEFEAKRPLDFVGFVRHMAFGFQQMNRIEHAKRGYARMLRANPLDLAAVVNLGILMERDGDEAGLRWLLETYDRAGGADRHVGMLAAKVSLAHPNWGVLPRLIERMVRQNPDDAELWQASFTIMANANAPLAAVVSAKRANELDQNRRFMCFRRHTPFNV